MAAVYEFDGDGDADLISPAANATTVADRYEVQPGAPLPDLSHRHARAFAARDIQNPEARVYALVLEPQLPARHSVLLSLKGFGRPGIVEPAAAAPAFWPPSNKNQLVLVITRPPGRPLMANHTDEAPRFSGKRLIEEVITPISRLLLDLSDTRISHRNIRPTNMFQSAPDAPVMLGECFSAPPGYAQPAIFEPVERAMAMPAGRGEGDAADDLYALGVSLLFLHRGNPMAKLSDAQMVHAKLEAGSFTALTAAARPPAELVEVLRGLLNDDPTARWTAKDLVTWLMGSHQSRQRDVRSGRPESCFRFGGIEHYSCRTLVHAMSQDWPAAVAAVQGEGLERWLRNGLKDRHLAEAVANARHSGGRGTPRSISDDLLTARVLIALDPDGPVRYRGFSAMPDGFPAAVAVAANDTALSTAFENLVSGMLPSFWSDQQPEKHVGRLAFQDLGMKLSRIMMQNAPGQGVERCLYTLNPTLSCLSPRIVDDCAVTVQEVMSALDANPDFTGDPPVDRHVAAFLASHMRTAIDRNLNEIGAATTPAAAVLAQLRLLALAQRRDGPPELSGLTNAFERIVGPILDTYHNLPLRARLKQAAEKAAVRGNLAALLAVVDNDRDRQWDQSQYFAARDRFAAIDTQIHRLREQRHRRPAMAARAGHRAAASLATVLSVLAAALIFINHSP